MLKFGLSLVQVGVAFLVLVWSASFTDSSFRTPLLFITLSYFLQSTGELCLSPVGMSQTTKLAPVMLVSTMMAVWFLGISWAEWIGGIVAQLAGTETIAGQVVDPARALATSAHVFMVLGVFAMAVGVLFLALSPWLSRWAHTPAAAGEDAPAEFPVDGERQTVDARLLSSGGLS